MVKIDIPGDDAPESSGDDFTPKEATDGREIDYRCERCGAPVYKDEQATFLVKVGMVCRICLNKKSPHRWWQRLS